MPVRPIKITGEPVLHEVAREVIDFDENLEQDGLAGDLDGAYWHSPSLSAALPVP